MYENKFITLLQQIKLCSYYLKVYLCITLSVLLVGILPININIIVQSTTYIFSVVAEKDVIFVWKHGQILWVKEESSRICSRDALSGNNEHVVYFLGVYDLCPHCGQVLRVRQSAQVLVGNGLSPCGCDSQWQVALTTWALVHALYWCFL